jgi:virginiamycin B lyase
MRSSLVLAACLALPGSTLSSCAPRYSVAPIAERALVTLKIPGFADFLAADGETIWTTNEGRVEQLRRDRSSPIAAVPVPEPCGAMAVAFDALWVANCSDSSLYRIDLKTRKVAAIVRTGLADPSGELSLAAGAGSVWVLTDEKGVLSRIDPRSNRVVARIQVAPYSFAAAFAFDAAWISNTGPAGKQGPGSVQRIDPATNRVIATIPAGPVPRFLAAGEGGVWTLNQGDGSVTHIDPRTNKPVATIQLGMQGSGGDIATGAGRVWVRGSRVLLVALDPATNRIVERFGPPAGSGAVRVAGNLVWVTAHDSHTVWVLRATR